jgi:hypothetical protein
MLGDLAGVAGLGYCLSREAGGKQGRTKSTCSSDGDRSVPIRKMHDSLTQAEGHGLAQACIPA